MSSNFNINLLTCARYETLIISEAVVHNKHAFVVNKRELFLSFTLIYAVVQRSKFESVVVKVCVGLNFNPTHKSTGVRANSERKIFVNSRHRSH